MPILLIMCAVFFMGRATVGITDTHTCAIVRR